MPTDRSLTGTWVGEYRQHDRSHPIRADLVQDGTTLAGSMRDVEPDQEMSVTEAVSASGEAPGADEQVVARLRALFPDQPVGPIRYVSHLPEESALRGEVQGARVAFDKSYRGDSFGGFKVGELIYGQKVEGHVVHYSGRLAAEGDEIEGRWWIDATPEPESRRIEGSFFLQRAEDGPTGGDR